jgi:hypothetical protein
MAKSPDLTYRDGTGFADLTPEQQVRMMKALGPLPRRWSPRTARSSGRRLVAPGNGHEDDQQAILAAVQARRDEVVTFEESS